jgi:hypothetical protein
VITKNGFQPRSNKVEDKNDDVFADFNSILNWWKNYNYQLLKVTYILLARQTEIDSAGPLVPKPSTFEAVISLLLKRLKIKITIY